MSQPAASTDRLPLHLLPQQPPFRFLDEAWIVGDVARGRWQVHGTEEFLKGHFPGRPIVPGVLIGESLAQLSGLQIGTQLNSPGIGFLGQIDLRCREVVVPPALFELSARLETRLGRLFQFSVEAVVAGRRVAEGSLALNLPTTPEGAP